MNLWFAVQHGGFLRSRKPSSLRLTMNPFQQAQHDALRLETRRHFLKQCGSGLGALALSSLLGSCFSEKNEPTVANPLAPRQPHFNPRVKSVIYLHMAGSPSQLELFDYKPQLAK